MAQHLARKRWASSAFTAGCLIVVAAISVHDAILLILNDQVILQVERNPVGRWLIEQGDGEVWLFVALKLVGTTTVCTVIVVLFPRWPQMSATIACTLAGLQIALLVYLTV